MPHKYTKEQADFIKDNVKGRTSTELTQLVNKHFGLNLGPNQIRAYMKNHGLTNGINKQFKPGSIPPNKGTKGLYNVGGNKTSFKKGNKPINYKQVGTERIDRDGYTLIKATNDGPWHKRWRFKHKVLWEKENGPVPKGHVLLFADSDKSNISLDNLILISRKQLARLNQNHLIANDADLTKTGLVIADIYSKIGDRKRKK